MRRRSSTPRYTLTEPFEEPGEWWHPDEPDRPIPGVHHFAEDDLRLRLFGRINLRPGEEGEGEGRYGRFTHLHGISDSGKRMTLLRVTEARINHLATGVSRSEYDAIYLIVGAHTSADDILRFKSMSFRASHLDAFVIAQFVGISEYKPRKIEVKYEAPEDAVFDVPSIGAQLKIELKANVRETRGVSATVTARTYVSLKTASPQPFDWFITNMWWTRRLLTLLADESVRPQEILFTGDEGESHGHLIHRSSRTRLGRDDRDEDMRLRQNR